MEYCSSALSWIVDTLAQNNAFKPPRPPPTFRGADGHIECLHLCNCVILQEHSPKPVSLKNQTCEFSSLLLLRYLSVVLHVSVNEPWRRLHSLRVYERQECQAFTWTAAQRPASLFACSDNHWIYLEPREALNKKCASTDFLYYNYKTTYSYCDIIKYIICLQCCKLRAGFF